MGASAEVPVRRIESFRQIAVSNWSTVQRNDRRRSLIFIWGIPCLLAAIGIGSLLLRQDRRDRLSAPGHDGPIEGVTDMHVRQVSSGMVRIAFENATRAAGITFRHFPAVRQSLLPEDMGSGLAWGDYDDDGDDDLFLVNFYGPVLEAIPAGAHQGRCALYRNDGQSHFTDVSREAGVDRACFGQGAAWGDYDNDDDLDLYVTCYGSNLLFRNNGDGGFTDVTMSAGVGDDRFSTGCAWGDYDRDGDVDLYVCNYVEFVHRPADRTRTSRQYGSETPYTLNPSTYEPERNLLFRNNGDGTFTDVAPAVGVADPAGRSLGVAWFDFDNDGFVDLYVANDISANGVFRNRGDGTFEDIGASSLAADYRGAMGLAVDDYDADGDLDLFVTHWVAQENAFFENACSEGVVDDNGRSRIFFMDIAYSLGLGHISLNMVGWATGLVDFDNDGHSDLWVVNGHTLEEPDDHTLLRPQHLQIFRQQPPDGFFEMARQVCPDLAEPVVGRGGAHADYDGDGRVDLAVLAHGGEPILLHNVSSDPGHWIAVRLRQAGRNTRALGARIKARTGDRLQYAQVGAGAPYLSQHSTDLHVGLGLAEKVDELTIDWPDGHQDVHRDVPGNRVVTYTHIPHYPAGGTR